MIQEYFSSLPVPECGVCVNGVSLEREILGYRTSAIKGRDDLSASIDEIEVGYSDGTTYRKKKDESKDITIEFNIVGETLDEYKDVKTRLKTLLYTDVDIKDLLNMKGVNLIDGCNNNTIKIGTFPATDGAEYTEGKMLRTNKVLDGAEYVLSFEAKSSVKGDVAACYLQGDLNENNITDVEVRSGSNVWINSGTDLNKGYARLTLPRVWTKFTIKYKKETGSDTSPKTLILGRLYKGGGKGTVYFRNVKMEVGNQESYRFANPNDLSVSENKSKELKVIFRDEPNYFFKGTVSNISFDQINTSGEDCYASSGTITLRLSNPYKYSVEEKVLTPTLDNKKTFVIDYEGNYKSYPKFEVINRSDNGYVGFVNERGNILQIGNPDEIDKESYKANENLATISKINSSSGISAATNYLHPHYKVGGTLAYTSGNYQLSSLNDPRVNGNWYCAIKTYEIPADSEGNKGCKNFYCYLNHWFETGLNGQTGEQSIVFLDKNNKIVCGYNIYKLDMTGNSAMFEMWANGRCIKAISFIPSCYDNHNPFNNGRGHNDILKEGPKIRFYWWGSYPSYTFPELADVEVTKIQISFAQYGTRNLSNQYVTRNYIRSVDFSKMNVNKWKDVPNKFNNNDVVSVNCQNGEIIHKGKLSPDLGAIGNDWENFYLKPGINQINCLNSNWVSYAPEFTIKFREVYL